MVLQHLEELHTENGILFDDFVEQNFCYREKPSVYEESWIGIFHHPPFIPEFGNNNEKIETYINTPEFKESKKNLKLALTLTEYHKKYLEGFLDCPVVNIKHPTFFGFKEWSKDEWNNNKDKSLIQLGFYLRNTQLINQIPIIDDINKIRLWVNKKWVDEYDKKVISHWETSNLEERKKYENYKNKLFVTPSQFDRLLSSNVIVAEYFTASASNAILDCINRNTPIIVNKHPAIVEYLGEDYPLYFNIPDEIPNLLNKVNDANDYLKNKDKTDLKIETFINNIKELLKKYNES